MANIIVPSDATTLVIQDKVIELISGDFLTFDFPNPVTNQISAPNGTTITQHASFDECDMTFSVPKLSESDAFLNKLMRARPIEVLDGTCTTVYKLNDQDRIETWQLDTGSFTTRNATGYNNVDGNAEQVYTVRWYKAIRDL